MQRWTIRQIHLKNSRLRSFFDEFFISHEFFFNFLNGLKSQSASALLGRRCFEEEKIFFKGFSIVALFANFGSKTQRTPRKRKSFFYKRVIHFLEFLKSLYPTNSWKCLSTFLILLHLFLIFFSSYMFIVRSKQAFLPPLFKNATE